MLKMNILQHEESLLKEIAELQDLVKFLDDDKFLQSSLKLAELKYKVLALEVSKVDRKSTLLDKALTIFLETIVSLGDENDSVLTNFLSNLRETLDLESSDLVNLIKLNLSKR